MAGYVHGVTPTHRLTIENERLLEEREQLLGELDKERAKVDRAGMDKRNAEARARRAERREQQNASRIIRKAQAEADSILLKAEQLAGVIQEVAYDKGRAMSERGYSDHKVRFLDERRAKQSTLERFLRTA